MIMFFTDHKTPAIVAYSTLSCVFSVLPESGLELWMSRLAYMVDVF